MIPKERARPLDQGDFGTCTLHAVANASVEKCMDFGLDFNLDEMVGGFKQLNFIDIVEGNDVHEFDKAVIKRMADKNTKKLYDVTLHIISHCNVEEDLLRKIQNKEVKCVLVYDQQHGESGYAEPHCVFIDELDTSRERPQFVCINSWGKDNYPKVVQEVYRPNNKVFEVTVTWQESRESSRWSRFLEWVRGDQEASQVPRFCSSTEVCHLLAKTQLVQVPVSLPTTVSLKPMFSQPVASSSFRSRVREQRICLESASFEEQRWIVGTVR